jgi:alkanesulfonate monooxygenase SsuD/methylene tetrahydromethanopterin reductase-like flavin-dependent oxidoreductase (luciferase family)
VTERRTRNDPRERKTGLAFRISAEEKRKLILDPAERHGRSITEQAMEMLRSYDERSRDELVRIVQAAIEDTFGQYDTVGDGEQLAEVAVDAIRGS